MRVGVLISGRGSNLQSLIDAQKAGTLGAEIALVVSNVPDVQGLERAAEAGIETAVVNHKEYDGRGPFEDALHGTLVAAEVELVCLAGFMRLLTDGFVARWHDRLINIHPSLLPAFKGLDTHQRALDAGVRFTGCTVHFVRPAMDEGPIIVQAAVPVLTDDDARKLAARVLEKEHEIYPHAVRLIADGRVEIVEERAIVAAATGPDHGLINPLG